MRRSALAFCVAATSVAALGGCGSVPRTELAWQALHALDVAQTYQIAESDCFRENGSAKFFIGEDPSVGEVAAWGIGNAAAHLAVTTLLERAEAPRWLRAGWQAVTIGFTGYYVHSNFDKGINPTGTGC